MSEGETLYVEVGAGGGAGGELIGGAGGGGSDIRTCSVNSSCPALGGGSDPRLIVAGGGGGGGSAGGGGSGGAAFVPGISPVCKKAAEGTNGSPGGSISGTGGSCEAGGLGGSPGAGGVAGANGAAGVGGAGGGSPSVYGGGGGGGGYFGGGGGGSGPLAPGNGAGGGGGSSYGPLGSIFASATSELPEVRITPLGAAMSVGRSALSFTETQPRQTISTPLALGLTNEGTAALVLSGLTFGGRDPQDFLVGYNGCLGEIAPGDTCRIGINFVPQKAGPRSAELVIQSNDPLSPARVGLSGNGGELPQGPAGPSGPAGSSGFATCKVKKAKASKKKSKSRQVACDLAPMATASTARLMRGRRTIASKDLSAGVQHVVFTVDERQGHGQYWLVLIPRG
ncbi:MAG TPA: choice-of-anchor D domain-containing protein [Solirubrobacterales bacterium]|nr:choice-of-anchor D domain-containing protein [Solirubrobacterales bacterium]